LDEPKLLARVLMCLTANTLIDQTTDCNDQWLSDIRMISITASKRRQSSKWSGTAPLATIFLSLSV